MNSNILPNLLKWKSSNFPKYYPISQLASPCKLCVRILSSKYTVAPPYPQMWNPGPRRVCCKGLEHLQTLVSTKVLESVPWKWMNNCMKQTNQVNLNYFMGLKMVAYRPNKLSNVCVYVCVYINKPK